MTEPQFSWKHLIGRQLPRSFVLWVVPFVLLLVLILRRWESTLFVVIATLASLGVQIENYWVSAKRHDSLKTKYGQKYCEAFRRKVEEIGFEALASRRWADFAKEFPDRSKG